LELKEESHEKKFENYEDGISIVHDFARYVSNRMW